MSQLVNHKPGRFTEAQQRVILAAQAVSLQAAKIVQAEVVARAPVRSGKLRSALAAADAITPSTKYRGAAVYGLTASQLSRDLFYAIFVEFGTKGYTGGQMRSWTTKAGKVRTKKATRAVPARPARPYFRPGVAAARAKVIATVGHGVIKALRD